LQSAIFFSARYRQKLISNYVALGILDDELDDPGSPRQYRWQPHANFRNTSEES